MMIDDLSISISGATTAKEMWESLTTVNLKESKPEGRLGTLAARRVYTDTAECFDMEHISNP